ncbi:uncharacterized protein LOC110253406 [Exaiptasia diaphana]|uniref:BZIP domain-containing protein n=1 Tax=Exaiptasia diaphana TaxID=2652724 RepID=A0A913Y7J5_EXADI|nr:uncharacterized protein LOC110253406 [Exaiptasia diaphana]
MGEPPPGESHPQSTEPHRDESILNRENNIPYDLDHQENDQWCHEKEVGERDQNGFTWDEFIPESLGSINSDFPLNEVFEHIDSIISDFASDEIDLDIPFDGISEDNVSTDFHSLFNDGTSEFIDFILSESEESHNFNSTVSWGDFGNDLHYSPDENQATIVGDRDHPNLLDNGGHVNRSAIPSVSHLTDQVGGSDIVIMPYSTDLYPEVNNDDNLLPVGDVVLQEGSHTNVAGLDTVPEVSHMNVQGPDTVPEGSHMNVPGPDTVPEGSYINVPGPDTVPEVSHINVPGPDTVPEVSHINVPGPDSVTEVICDSYSDGTMSSPENIQNPIDDLINSLHHSLPQITNPELESIFAMSDIASAPSIQPIQPSLADVGGHVDLCDIDEVTVPSVNHQVGISDTPIISSPTNMHSEVNNGDHLIPDGDNVDMESRTCTSGNHCRSLHEINCESNSVGDVLTTGSGQISTAFPSAIGAQVPTSSTSDGAVPTVLHQVTSQFSTIPVNAVVAVAMVPVVLIQPNLENSNNWNPVVIQAIQPIQPSLADVGGHVDLCDIDLENSNNWNPVVIQANNGQVLQSSTSQNSDEKEKRREQNRVSSRKCRKRKRESEEKLFAEEEKLSRENARLRGEVERLSKEIETIKKDWFHQ